MHCYWEYLLANSNVGSQIKIMATSRTQETEKNYANRASMLRCQAAKKFGVTSIDSVPMVLVIEHLLSIKPNISANTWRQYKAALYCEIEKEISMTPDPVDIEELEAARRMLDRETCLGTKKKGSATSAKKLKGIRKDDFDILIQYLRNHISIHRYANALLTWICAAEKTGLRPSEWNGASIIEDNGCMYLRVKNAKYTNGRGNGEYRHLNISELDHDSLESIHEMILMLDGHMKEMSFKSFYEAIKNYMNKAARNALGKRTKYPTLYSFRHQFTANAKASGFTKAEVAALLGQASDATAPLHYARKVQGRRGSVKVKPLSSEVETVRNKHTGFNYADYKNATNFKK